MRSNRAARNFSIIAVVAVPLLVVLTAVSLYIVLAIRQRRVVPQRAVVSAPEDFHAPYGTKFYRNTSHDSGGKLRKEFGELFAGEPLFDGCRDLADGIECPCERKDECANAPAAAGLPTLGGTAVER